MISPKNTKLNDQHFHTLQVMSRYRNPQLNWVKINDLGLTWNQTFANLDIQTLISFLIAVTWSTNKTQ